MRFLPYCRRNAISQISRLEALHGQIAAEMNSLYENTVSAMRDGYGATLTESYHKKVYDMQCRSGFMGEFAKMTPKMGQHNIVSYPWTGAHFSDRLWQHKERFLLGAREVITQGIIQGKSIPAMSKQLSDIMGQSYKNAERVIRTETNHFHNEASKAAYNGCRCGRVRVYGHAGRAHL